jgi:transporter family-2 protein
MREFLVNVLFCLLVVGGGLSVSFQQVLNAKLRAELGSPWWAGLVSFLGGSFVMLTAAVLTSQPLPSSEAIARTSWASWSGGFFGAFFIGAAILMVPRLGATTVVALVVFGQMLGALAFDHFGILGIPGGV